MTVSRPSLRIRRGRWRTRALAASPTAAERTARCSTGVRRAPKNSSAMARSLLFALLRFLCRPGRWSTRLKLQRPPEGSPQVDGNVARIDLAAGVSMALLSISRPSGQSDRNVSPPSTCKRPGQTSQPSKSIFAYTLLRKSKCDQGGPAPHRADTHCVAAPPASSPPLRTVRGIQVDTRRFLRAPARGNACCCAARGMLSRFPCRRVSTRGAGRAPLRGARGITP